MKIEKLLLAFALVCFFTVSCKKEGNKEAETQKEEVASKIEEASFAISGMTCEVGCAKVIASKLSKKEGIIDAEVVFSEKSANIKFDANKTNKKDIIAFIDGIADGTTYKASEASKKTSCESSDEKKSCCKKEEGKDTAVKECCDKKEKEMACTEDCKNECHAKA
ncbi:Heavy-metal-associated domain-containing protein [Tenacibaculum sp. MAR_2009_124]|uniref:cation transporter n=1 Tax=Tenacibaculum sp. MAR_2009_124 TaxID=1250059 RepID=UPI00089C67A4|nr:heavy-metal-associated domain-containing protein [Tenacibaculum sp. MAR_2009_124]SEC26972.1 Heavy-metal-associated domain-containing protein [Tenacibaculum sp. MAR_2009_124]